MIPPISSTSGKLGVEADDITHDGEVGKPKLISIRRWSLRAISFSHNMVRASRMESARRTSLIDEVILLVADRRELKAGATSV